MKHISGFVVIVTALLLSLTGLFAGNSDVEIHCSAKKVNEMAKKASDGGANKTKENWNYEVTMENKTFKDMANIEVKYAIFYTQEKLGVKADPTPRHQNGSFSIPALKSREKKSFTTDQVELSKSNLVGNWIYSSGAKPNAQDRLVGLAIKVFQNGQLFAEYANPSTLSKENWN